MMHGPVHIKSDLHWLAFQTAFCRLGPNSRQIPSISPSNNAQYLSARCLHRRQPVTLGEFRWKFHFFASKTQWQIAVWCIATRLRTNRLFRTEYNTNHYVNQAVPQGKLKLKDQWKRYDEYVFKVTLFLRGTCAKALLYRRPTHLVINKAAKNGFGPTCKNIWSHSPSPSKGEPAKK